MSTALLLLFIKQTHPCFYFLSVWVLSVWVGRLPGASRHAWANFTTQPCFPQSLKSYRWHWSFPPTPFRNRNHKTREKLLKLFSRCIATSPANRWASSAKMAFWILLRPPPPEFRLNLKLLLSCLILDSEMPILRASTRKGKIPNNPLFADSFISELAKIKSCRI